jgi:hypothetical protein
MRWSELNAALLVADEAKCAEYMTAEKGGRCRKDFLLRIHSRLNKVRADRERYELVTFAAGRKDA